MYYFKYYNKKKQYMIGNKNAGPRILNMKHLIDDFLTKTKFV